MNTIRMSGVDYRILSATAEHGYSGSRGVLIQRRYPDLGGLWCDVGDPHPDAGTAYRALLAHVYAEQVTP